MMYENMPVSGPAHNQKIDYGPKALGLPQAPQPSLIQEIEMLQKRVAQLEDLMNDARMNQGRIDSRINSAAQIVGRDF